MSQVSYSEIKAYGFQDYPLSLEMSIPEQAGPVSFSVCFSCQNGKSQFPLLVYISLFAVIFEIFPLSWELKASIKTGSVHLV